MKGFFKNKKKAGFKNIFATGTTKPAALAQGVLFSSVTKSSLTGKKQSITLQVVTALAE